MIDANSVHNQELVIYIHRKPYGFYSGSFSFTNLVPRHGKQNLYRRVGNN
jgi:hypothetical protein